MENEIINFLLYSNIPPLIGLFVGCWVVVKRLDRFKSELIEKIDRVSEKIEIFRNELTEKIDLLKSELNEKIHSNETKIKKSTFP